jgi:hypothetical protein
MTTPERPSLNEEALPISESLFGEINLASPPDAVEIAKTLPEPNRAQLAVFCYYRRHLHALGMMIASTCGRSALVNAGGRAGSAIFDQSRDPRKTLSAEWNPVGSSATRKPISLAGRAASAKSGPRWAEDRSASAVVLLSQAESIDCHRYRARRRPQRDLRCQAAGVATDGAQVVS